MINNKVKSIRFFTKEEYKYLKHKTLSRDKYKLFIETCNRRIAREVVVGSKEGWELPQNLGKLQIHKNFNIKGTKHKTTGETIYNYHTMGYIYRCRFFVRGRRVVLSPKYSTKYGLERVKEVPTMFYRWNNHRANIDRHITELVYTNKADFKELPKGNTTQ